MSPRSAALVVALMSPLSCQVEPVSPPPTPPPVPTVEIASCESACARLRALGCPAGQDTPKGAPCERVCENIYASGIWSWDVDCISAATSCAGADACPR